MKHLPILASVLLLAACAAPKSSPPPRAATAPTASARARALLKRAADSHDPARAQEQRLDAVRLFLNAGAPGDAQAALRGAGRPEGERLAWRMAALRAGIALADDNTSRALAALTALPKRLPGKLGVKVGRLRAHAYRREGWLEGSALERVRLDTRLKGKARQRNEAALWRTLTDMSLRQLRTPPAELASVRGWWSLAAIAVSDAGARAGALPADLARWRQRYPGHPASAFAARLGQQAPPIGGFSVPARPLPSKPTRVALLLPLSGALAPAGHVIAAGFRAASAGTGERVRAFDTARDGSKSAYSAAARWGADVAVGPLTRAGVAALAVGSRPVPLLALNVLPGGVPASDATLVLDPRAPARRVGATATAAAAGCRRVGVLAGGDAIDRGLAQAFEARFQALGGRVVRETTVDGSSNRLTATVRAFMGLGSGALLWRDARPRGSRMAAVHRIGCAFIAAPPIRARLLRALLSFYHAVDLPVYAVPRVFSDTLMARRNVDLDGVVVCDVPSVISAPADHGGAPGLLRLRGLGRAAARVVARGGGAVTAAAMAPGVRVRVGANGLMHPALECARFHNGRLRRLPASRKVTYERMAGSSG